MSIGSAIGSSIGSAIGSAIAGGGGGSSVPALAIKDRTDDPILDRSGAYIEQRV